MGQIDILTTEYIIKSFSRTRQEPPSEEEIFELWYNELCSTATVLINRDSNPKDHKIPDISTKSLKRFYKRFTSICDDYDYLSYRYGDELDALAKKIVADIEVRSNNHKNRWRRRIDPHMALVLYRGLVLSHHFTASYDRFRAMYLKALSSNFSEEERRLRAESFFREIGDLENSQLTEQLGIEDKMSFLMPEVNLYEDMNYKKHGWADRLKQTLKRNLLASNILSN